MNIFVLDRDIAKCAMYHSDRHVVKMVLESAQMLCTVLHENGMNAPYKPTHRNHPCTLWTGRSLSNWLWLRNLALALNDEFMYRYEKELEHASATVVRGLPHPPLEDRGLTVFAQAMPEQYRIPGDAVAAYRRFYVAEKAHFAVWTRREVPEWFEEEA
ncbi:MAG: hypothetical protein GF388_11115 [Candidatus Aegiribacteria sp.]|nr:hypothetical protein [Candidatus Aegiribacteria sp.]MBD3295549.1 hypothetical protein [Candidatus Fermentibacteria bacterium]